MTSLSVSSQSTRPTGQVLWEELLVLLDFNCNYEQTSGIFCPLLPITFANSLNPDHDRQKNPFWDIIRMSNSLGPDQD